MRKTYTLNKKFFREWSSEMAYLLGYIYADGSMDRKKYRIRISSVDKDQLETVRSLIDSNKPISSASNKNGSWYNFNIQNKEIYADLRKLGIFPNKSLTMRLPNIPKAYKIDFIRGYFDGDGSIQRVKRKRPTPGMEVDFATGSKDFAEKFTIMLNDVIDDKFYFKKKRVNYYNIRCSTSGAESFYNKVYYKNCIHMKRKKEKFENIIEERSQNLGLR